MSSSDKLFLIGMPGSGKSTLGRSLATELDRPFMDLDDEIEKAANQTIKQLFDSRGEDYFRSLEMNVLSEKIQSESPFVLATGGGTPCFYNNMDLINNSGFSIFIDVSVQALHNRLLETNIADRPKLGDSGLIDQLSKTRENRIFYYSKANLTISGDDITLQEIQGAIFNIKR